MIALKQYIRSYYGVTDIDLDIVASFFVEEGLEKGEYFSRAGQYCNKMSFVNEGCIRVFVEVNDKEITQWISSQESLVTDLNSFVFGQRARWTSSNNGL